MTLGSYYYYLAEEIGGIEVVCDVVLTWSPAYTGLHLEDVDVDPETILEGGEVPRDPHTTARLIEAWIFDHAEDVLDAASEYCAS